MQLVFTLRLCQCQPAHCSLVSQSPEDPTDPTDPCLEPATFRMNQIRNTWC